MAITEDQVQSSAPFGKWIADGGELGVVSVIVPTYNRSRVVLDALDSIFTQTYRPIELIVVDDGSTDDTAVTVQAWMGERKSRAFQTRFLQQPRNCGACAARNLGARHSSGEYIQFWDSDDEMMPVKLERQVGYLGRERTGVVGCLGARHVVPGSRWERLVANRGAHPVITGSDWGEGLGCTLAILMTRERLLELGPWNERLPVRQDAEYLLRMLRDWGSIPLIMEPMYRIGRTPASITRCGERGHSSLAKALLLIREQAEDLPSGALRSKSLSHIARQLNYLAREFVKRGKLDRGMSLFREAQKHRGISERLVRAIQFHACRVWKGAAR